MKRLTKIIIIGLIIFFIYLLWHANKSNQEYQALMDRVDAGKHDTCEMICDGYTDYIKNDQCMDECMEKD